MTQNNNPFASDKLAKMAEEAAQRGSAMHEQFLQRRRDGMLEMQRMIATQLGSTAAPARPALFDSRQLDEFGTGLISHCLGADFAKYDSRRIPRIPNGDLKMMTRVVEISGTPRQYHQPASVTVEYDVPEEAWYMRETVTPHIPTSLFMEIALQPCGFLSAYLDTYAAVPYGDFYFRNLDGYARVVASPDVRGKTITTHARLLNSIIGGGTVIQKFAFALTCEGQTLYEGESSFGYFSVETMANQVGLDGGKRTLPWLREPANSGAPVQALDLRQMQAAKTGKPHYRLPSGKLHFVDSIAFVPGGGRYGQGYLLAARPVNHRDWFYPFHFHGDPVMPGSLGVEAILETMQAGAMALDLGGQMQSPRFDLSANAPQMDWRYRGQITPAHKTMELEVHLSGVLREGANICLLGDASLWVDGLRIYEVKNASVGLFES